MIGFIVCEFVAVPPKRFSDYSLYTTVCTPRQHCVALQYTGALIKTIAGYPELTTHVRDDDGSAKLFPGILRNVLFRNVGNVDDCRWAGSSTTVD